MIDGETKASPLRFVPRWALTPHRPPHYPPRRPHLHNLPPLHRRSSSPRAALRTALPPTNRPLDRRRKGTILPRPQHTLLFPLRPLSLQHRHQSQLDVIIYLDLLHSGAQEFTAVRGPIACDQLPAAYEVSDLMPSSNSRICTHAASLAAAEPLRTDENCVAARAGAQRAM